MLEAVLLAVALAMDATAVAAARAVTGLRRRTAVALAVSFGVFQAGMAAIGWALGRSAKGLIEQWDHWVAFGLLALVGGKMIVDSLRRRTEPAGQDPDLGLRAILLLSIATSIDALAAGVTLPLLSVAPVVALALIGVAALGLSLLGALAGRALGARLGRRLGLVGGITLIAIGTKTLIEHLTR